MWMYMKLCLCLYFKIMQHFVSKNEDCTVCMYIRRYGHADGSDWRKECERNGEV